MLTITDILAGINLMLVIMSFILAAGILAQIGGGTYTLSKGWKFFFPAFLVFAVIRMIDFFQEYSAFSAERLVREGLMFVFSALIFIGLWVQYFALEEARRKIR